MEKIFGPGRITFSRNFLILVPEMEELLAREIPVPPRAQLNRARALVWPEALRFLGSAFDRGNRRAKVADEWDAEFAKVLAESAANARVGTTAAADRPTSESLQARAPRDVPEYAKGHGELAAALRESAESKIAKVRSSHDVIADMMICHPEMTKQAIAAKLGYTPTYLSIVTGSDAFKVRLANRRAQFVDPVVQASVEEMFGAMTERACEVLLEKLNQPTNVVDPQLALQAAQLGAKVAGMGGFGAKTAVINVTPSEERLNRLADNLTRLAGGQGLSAASGASKAVNASDATDAIVVSPGA